MAKRRRKQKDQTAELLVGTIFFFTIVGWLITRSLVVAIIIFVVLFVAVMLIQFMIAENRREKLRRSGIADIDKMEGRQFEYYLGQLFKSHGYTTEVTKASGDFGADLILKRNGVKIAVQAKRYSSNIGIKAVQEIHAALAHYGASEAWVVSNQEFTAAACELAESTKVKLIGRQALIELILKMNPNAIPNPKAVVSEIPYADRKCKRCGNLMTLRKGSRGEFWGCSSFPKCRNVENLGD